MRRKEKNTTRGKSEKKIGLTDDAGLPESLRVRSAVSSQFHHTAPEPSCEALFGAPVREPLSSEGFHGGDVDCLGAGSEEEEAEHAELCDGRFPRTGRCTQENIFVGVVESVEGLALDTVEVAIGIHGFRSLVVEGGDRDRVQVAKLKRTKIHQKRDNKKYIFFFDVRC